MSDNIQHKTKSPHIHRGSTPQEGGGFLATLKESPILFSTPLVPKVIDLSKNQTRRLTGLDKVNADPNNWEWNKKVHTINRFWDSTKEKSPNPIKKYFVFDSTQTEDILKIRSPFGDKPGDLLYVRETFFALGKWILTGTKTKSGKLKMKFIDKTIEMNKNHFFMAASEKPENTSSNRSGIIQWNKRNSIHMPKVASRIWLEVVDIYPERLQSISQEDAIAEGVFKYGPFGEYAGSVHPSGGAMKYRAYQKASRAFQCIWESINGEESWNKNPWVWRVKYKLLSSTGKPQECYKTGDLCKHNCHGLCKESC